MTTSLPGTDGEILADCWIQKAQRRTEKEHATATNSELQDKIDDLEHELWRLEHQLEKLDQIVRGYEEDFRRQEFRLDQLDIRLAQLQKENPHA